MDRNLVPEGTHGTLRATGADTDIIYTDHSFKDLGYFDAIGIWPTGPYPNETDAFSCTTENNKTITWGNYIDLENIALAWPQQNAYARQQSHPRLQRRQTLAMEPPNTNKQPEKGIHIDYINKTIKW